MKQFLPLLLLTLIGYAATAQKKIDTSYNAADLLFISQQNQFTRDCPTCTCTSRPPFTIILPGLAKDRMRAYQNKINDCGLKLATEVEYTINGAIDLLTKFTYKTDYDGFRAYIGVYPSKQPNPSDSGYNLVPKGQEDKLTVIYVPTKWKGYYRLGWIKHRRHIDDTVNCRLINGDQAVLISARFASMWINKAQHRVLDTLESRRRHKWQRNFRETHNLWYNIDYVKHSDDWSNGLLDILECKKCCYPKTKVYAKFAAFVGSNFIGYRKKLSIVFQLDIGETKQYLTLNSFDRSPWAKYAFKKEFAATGDSSGGSDTGKPCPPPSPCGTDVGVLLPNQ